MAGEVQSVRIQYHGTKNQAFQIKNPHFSGDYLFYFGETISNNAKESWKTVESICGMNKHSLRVSCLKAGEHLLNDNEQMASEV